MKPISDDDIVISGISGRYPKSANLQEFWDNLSNSRPMYSDENERWTTIKSKLPLQAGFINYHDQFDADLFGVSDDLANFMDPQQRLLHETTYEAIFDAGLDPFSLGGQRSGFFVGSCYNDTSYARSTEHNKTPKHFERNAQFVCDTFNFHGTSLTVDTACAASFSALHQAMQSFKTGDIDCAVIGALSVHLKPQVTLGFMNLRMLSPEGTSKSLDAGVDGYCRSEAIVSILLQKRKDAKRIYSTIYHSETNCDGYKPEGITFPSMDAQYVLMKKVYEDCKLDPERHITYVEGHMTGTPVGDPVETLAIVKALRPNKSRPLLMGALKSNMGHSEGASALCGISKVALIFQQGYIPPNINYSSPNPNIESLKDGTVIPILENTPFSEDFIALNAFGFGGVNVHAILKANEKQSSPRDYKIFDSKYKLPEDWYKKSELHSLKDFDKFVSKCKKGQLIRLVNFPNRTAEGCECAFEFLKNNREKINNDYLQLIEDLCNIDPSTKLNHHGFMTWSPDGEILTKKTAKIEKKRPIYLVFSGLGCQWIQMGADLLEFEMFARKIVSLNEHCKKNFNFSLIEFITKAHDEAEFKKDPAKNLIAISSIQMALIDFINFLEIEITGFIGHSVGEYACAYADGKATSEQIISCIYELVKEVNKLGGGAMASVGLSVKQIESKLPEGVEICCDNSSENVTIGGSNEVIEKLLKKFEKDEIFVRKVDSCGQLYHSKKAEKCHANVLATFKKILGAEKLNRSSKWISTSVDKNEEEPENLAKYLADNVVKRVLFTEAINSLKDDICCVEVGPHTQLLPLIKQQKGRLATCVGTMKKNDIGKNLNNVFAAIGEIFNNGHSAKVSKLFTPVEYPVSRETLSLSHLVKLDHSIPRFVYRFPEYFNTACLTRQFEISFDNPKYKSWYGHVIDGRILLPATGYLFLAWDVLFQKQNLSAMSNSITIPIEFRDVSLKRAIVLNKGAPTNIKIKLLENTGEFNISESDQVCCTGFMNAISDSEKKIVPELYKAKNQEDNKELVQTADIYKELRVRGYDYQGDFQGIIECHASGRQGKVKWNNSWVAFADALLQISILGEKSRSLFVPTHIEYLRCEIDSLNAYCESCKKQNIDPVFEVYFDPVVGIGSSLGMLVKGMKVTETPRRTEKQKAFLQEYAFVPYENKFVLEKDSSKKLTKYDETVNKLTKGFANKIEKLEEVELSFKELNDKYNDKELHSVANLLLDVMKSNHLIEEKPEEKSKEEVENAENSESNEIVEVKTESKIKTDENNNEIENTDENNNQEEEAKKEVKKLDLNETIQERQEALSHDLLFSNNYHLIFANHIAVILENLNSKQVKLLEINYTPSLLMDYLSYQISVAQVRTEYNLYHPMPALKSISSKYGINKVLEIKSDSTISNEFNASHIVAYKHWSTGFINSLETLDLGHYKPAEEQEKTLIKNTFEHLLDGGFLIFCYRTKLTLIEEQLMEFGGQNSQIEFVSREKILGWIKEAGFEYIAEEKSDEQSCSTILARKVSKELVKVVKENEEKPAEEAKKEETKVENVEENKEEAKEEEFEMENPLDPIPIEAKLFDYTWVERVKKELQKKSSRRIWLIARDSTMNGIIGMMKCLKKEPEGERIRCLFNIDECDDKTFVENKIKNGLGVPEYPEEIAEREEKLKKEEESKKEKENKEGEENKKEDKTEDKKEEPKEIELEEIDEKEILALKKMISEDLINKDLTTNVIFENQLGSYRQKVFNPELEEETDYAVLDIITKGDLSSLRWLSSNMKEGFATPALLYPLKTKVQHDVKAYEPFIIDLHYSALNFKDIMVASGRVPRSAYPSTELAVVNAIGMECSGTLKDGSRVMAILPGSGISTKFVLLDKTNVFDVPENWSMAQAATVPVVYMTVYYSLFLRGKLMKGEKILIHAGSGGVGFAAISVCLAYGCEVFTTVSNEKKKKFLQEHFPSLQERNFANSRDVNFEEHILKETNGYGVDLVLNSLSEEKLRASIRCLAPFGRFLEIGKYDIIQNNSIDTTALGQNRTFHAICLAHLLAEMTEDINGVASTKWNLCCDLLRKGIKNNEVKPLNFTVFKKYECEQAFRYMANGKHMGKVLIQIKPEEENENSLTKVIPKTKCDPRKSYIITGGLGGFGIELSIWLISLGARNLILTSRTGIKNTYQEMQVRKMREEGAVVIISNETCDTLESTKRLLEAAEKLGPIEGIFHLAMVLQDSIFTNQTRKLFKTVCEPKVNSTFFLDYLTRDENKYSALKHFICFSSIASGIGNPGQTNYAFANSAMERIVEKRTREMGPNSKCKSKAIQWGAIGDVGAFAEKFGNDVNIAGMVPQRIISCMKTMDEIMQYNVSLLSSIVLQDDTKINALGGERGNLVKTIMHVLGVNDPSTLDPNVTLTELGMDSLMAVEIKQGLEREYDIVMTTQEIRGLTYKRLQEMSAELEERDKNKGKNESESEKDNLAKLEEIFNKKDELFVELSTTQSNASNQPIFFVPPIEGDFVIMRKVTKYLTRPVIGINWISEFDDKAKIQDVATIVSKRLIEKYGNCEFDFVGYSFGSVLGLEIAIQLQINTSATVRKFIMLDGSPEFTKAKSHEIANTLEFTDANSDKIMTTMLVKFSEHVMKVDNLDDFTEKLLKLPDLNSRCQSVVTLIESKFNFKVDQEKMLKTVQSMFNKCRMVFLSDISSKLTGDILLIRATDNKSSFIANSVSESYGIEKVCTGKTEVIKIEGDHITFITNNAKEIGHLIDNNTLYLSI